MNSTNPAISEGYQLLLEDVQRDFKLGAGAHGRTACHLWGLCEKTKESEELLSLYRRGLPA